MSGGGKGGSQTAETSVPDWVEQPARRNLARAEEISKIGYVPYGGPEVAAFTDGQNAAFSNNNAMANAYGMQGGANTMPQPTQYAGGVQGYSSLPLYDEAIAQLAASRPGQYGAIMRQFLNPNTGAGPGAQTAAVSGAPVVSDRDSNEPGRDDWGLGAPSGGTIGGYSGVRDMFDGGGPGVSGGAFQGAGRYSDVANFATGRDSSGGGGAK